MTDAGKKQNNQNGHNAQSDHNNQNYQKQIKENKVAETIKTEIIGTKETLEKRIKEIEDLMLAPDFWVDKEKAKNTLSELKNLKEELLGADKYDSGSAVLSVLAGAGGDDAEDFANMLFRMYQRFVQKKGWLVKILHINENDHGGIRNIVAEIIGKGVYGALKTENGVHRLVRISPFNAKSQRHTSFALVEIIPKFEKEKKIALPENEIRVEFSKSGGPGGQNVNKRETAVRVVHIPTNISFLSDNERSQAQNKEKALEVLSAKVYVFREEEKRKREKGLSIKGTVEIEWGNQIRSYVLHPYKMVKDHRTGIETSQIEDVLDGDIEIFLQKPSSDQ